MVKQFPDINLAYVHQNVSKTKKDSPYGFLKEISHEAKEALLNNNQLDKKLYERVNQGLENLSQKIPEFDSKLADFKKRSEGLKPRFIK